MSPHRQGKSLHDQKSIRGIAQSPQYKNYGMYKCASELKEIRANTQPITDRHMAIIKRETLHYRKFDPLSVENAEKLAIWKGVPTFDLREQRDRLRKSGYWRW